MVAAVPSFTAISEERLFAQFKHTHILVIFFEIIGFEIIRRKCYLKEGMLLSSILFKL